MNLKLIRQEFNRRVSQGMRLTVSNMASFAEAYSFVRGNSSLFALVLNYGTFLQIVSSAGILAREKYVEFPSDDPKRLMSKALIDRVSIHVPDISAVSRESLVERIEASGGNRVFGKDKVPIELISDDQTTSSWEPSGQIIAMLLLEFSRTTGSVLLTPLGLERSTKIGVGFIYEYKEEGCFSPQSIQEARRYSAFFMLQIAQGFLEEQG